MLPKLALSIAAAFVLCAGVVRAEPAKSRNAPEAAEAGIPDSVANHARTFSGHSPSNMEINAAETGNPDSVDNRDRMPVSSKPISDSEWVALEFSNPEIH